MQAQAPLPTAPISPPPSGASRPAHWAERGIGPAWHHQFFYWMMRLGGKARGYHLANIASVWYVLFYPSIRRRCSFYLRRRFPDRGGAMQTLIDTYRLVRAYATTLVDMLMVRSFGPESMASHCPDRDRLTSLASGERGFVLIHAHLGCWQIGMFTLGHLPKAVSIVVIPESQTGSSFEVKNLNPIDPRTGLQSSMRMTEALLRGDILVMMGDRTLGDPRNVVPVQFLGGTAMLPITPYRLASATGVPVVVMSAPRTGRRSYELRLAKVIEVPPGLGRNARDYAPYARQFAECMEAFVRDYPWQFYNFYDVWTDDAPPF